MKHTYKKYLLIIIIFLIVDIFSKYWICTYINLYEIKKIFSILNIFHVHNYGVAFSILSNKTLWNRLFLLTLSAMIIFLLIKKFFQLKQKYKKLSYCFIISGAIGNFIDRMYHGFVIDFIDIHISTLHFPTFNISDCYIFIGIFIYIKNHIKLLKKNIFNIL